LHAHPGAPRRARRTPPMRETAFTEVVRQSVAPSDLAGVDASAAAG